MEPDVSEHASPGVTGIHHFSITVTDLEASLAWYQRLLGADRVPMKFPHYDREDTGYGELLVDPRSGQSHASSVFGEREMPIAPLLEKRMGMPVKIEKPAHLVALAESWFGYAQRNRSFAVVTVDQTAGLGLWYEDDLLRGASTLGPAFGHIKVGKDERPCECGEVWIR